jgi:hypothetical protein
MNFKRVGRRSYGLAFVLVILLIAQKRHLFRLNDASSDVYTSTRGDHTPISFHLDEVGQAAGLRHSFECFTPDSTNFKVIDRLCAQQAAVAVADIDGDGYQDLFFTTMKEGTSNHLYRNQGDGTFEDITVGSGLDNDRNEVPTTGALFFDYNNDGLEDLFILKAGCHRLYQNLGHGHFKDVSVETGVAKVCSNGTAVNALDYNKDGFLDIVIGNFFDGQSFKNLDHPIMPESGFDSRNGGYLILLKNMNGRGFNDVSTEMGLHRRFHTWAIGISDFDHDGYPDIFLGNDHGPSAVFHNDHGRIFRDETSSSGVRRIGRGAMNADVADFDNSGNSGIYVTDITLPGLNLSGNVLWAGNGRGQFKNRAVRTGANSCGWSWGAKFLDLNRDGWLDLFVTNGFWKGETDNSYYYPLMTADALPSFLQKDQRIFPPTRKFSHSATNENCVFVRQGDKFVDVAEQAGAAVASVGKAVAVIDFKNDGTQGVVVTSSAGRPLLYKNTVNDSSHWIGFKLHGTRMNRDAWGSVVRIVTDVGSQTRELYPANGFKSVSDSRLYFGLGSQVKISKMEITWPDGHKQELHDFKIDSYHDITEEE